MAVADSLLERWFNGEDISLDDFGGPEQFLADAADLVELEPLTVVEVVCTYWDAFESLRPDAVAILIEAADIEDAEMDTVHDVLLRNPDVLGSIAKALEPVIASRAQTPGLYGDIATETWTRLALGDLSSSYSVRGHLQRRVTVAGPDATIHLVRSVAAALNGWNDQELLPSIRALGELDQFDADVEFELAMLALGAVGASGAPDGALAHLREAVMHLEASEHSEGRVDATAYLHPLRALLRFADGGSVSAADVAEARSHINSYLTGYRGLRHHWRQGYADVCDGWATLTGLLATASTATDEDWFNPASIIDAAGALFMAENSIELVVRDKGNAEQTGVATLLRPRLSHDFVEHKPGLGFLDQWLSQTHSARHPDLVLAVTSLRDSVTSEVPPKASGGSGSPAGPATGYDDVLRDSLEAKQRPSRADVGHARRIRDAIAAIVPQHELDNRVELTGLLLPLVQFTGYLLNQPQMGPRQLPLFGSTMDAAGQPVAESFLADSMCAWLVAAGISADLETQAAGGRADIRVLFPDCRFFMEVKRVTSPEDDKIASAHYGDQAAQYAVTSVPITFLALLDFSRRETRLDLDTAIWTTKHNLPDVLTDYALTGFRIQANTATPSAATRAFRRGRRKKVS